MSGEMNGRQNELFAHDVFFLDVLDLNVLYYIEQSA